MKRIILLFAFTCSVLMSFAEGGTSVVPFADPYILLDGDTYYAYGTHSSTGIECYTSDNLKEWTYEGHALSMGDTDETRYFWAPEVYKINGTYYMYYSANEHLYVATSQSPKGPFKQVGGYQMSSILGSEKCIDSSVFFDDDGTVWMYFVRFTDGNCIWKVQLSDDYITPVSGTLTHCISVSQSWEQKQGRVVEGPNMIKHNGTYYLTYSANDYQSQDYGVGYATAKDPAGPWTKYRNNPILHKNEGLVGVGHHSLFTDKEGKLRIVFHAHYSTTAIHPRVMYIGTMEWYGNTLRLADEPFIRPAGLGCLYSPNIVDHTWGYQRGGSVAVDLNNDGLLDILAGGSGNNVTNESSNTIVQKRQMDIRLATANSWNTLDGTQCAIQVADGPSLIPCDINGDGNMDIVAFETPGTNVSDVAVAEGYSKEGVFLGNGDGTFRPAQLTITGTDFDFDIHAPQAADVIDIDNDGLLDIVCAGYQGTNLYNVVLHNKGVEGESIAFEAIPWDNELRLQYAIVEAYDFNNDSYTDFIVSAYVTGKTGMNRLTDIYLNDPDHPGTFSPLGLGNTDSGVLRKGYGALQVADFNNDGYLDFFLAGVGDRATGESAHTQRLYLNSGGAKPTFTCKESDLHLDNYKPQNYVNNAAGVFDWFGDGNFHLMLVGQNTSSNNSTGRLYKNDGTGMMEPISYISGAIANSVIFIDYNRDGRKDFCVSGQTSDNNYLASYQFGKVAMVTYNDQPAPELPDMPTGLEAEAGENGVTLSWQAPASAKGNVTYEYYVKDENGRYIVAPTSFAGGENDGKRKVNHLGNAGQNHRVSLHPHVNGTFSWGVQTVNAAYDGSPFAEGPQFVYNGTSGINVLETAVGEAEPTAYNVNGQRIGDGYRGILIVKKADGKARKVVRK